jgi:hypothetical protein
VTKYLPAQARIEGSFPVVVNGAQTILTEGASFTDTTALLAALTGAGISYEDVPLDATTGAASGRIKILGTGSSASVGVNGTIYSLPVGSFFTPDTGVTEALDHSSWTYVREYVDGTCDAFTFTDATGVTTSSTQTSDAITVSGLGVGVSVAVSITGGTYSKNGGSYVSTAGTAVNGDTFAVRHTASASAGTAVNTVLTIGGVSDTFTSTTASGPVELVTNGDFSAGSTGWTVSNFSGGTNIGAGVATLSDATDDGDSISQILTGVVAGTYRVVWTIPARTSGSIKVKLSGISAAEKTSTGTFQDDIVLASAGSGNLVFQKGTTIANGIKFDNVSVTRIA